MLNTKSLRRALCAITLGWCALSAAAQTQDLYNPSAGLPTSQEWALIGTVTQTLSGGLLKQDTTADLDMTSGSARFLPTVLNTATGFSLRFDLQVLSESHNTPNRAGFSFIAVGQDPRHAIEVAFWQDRVWAYAYDATTTDHFVHGTEAMFDTSSSSHTFELQVLNQQFAVRADGNTLLTGALVDYRAQGLPYTVPNFIFFGDNTSRAASSVLLGKVTLGAAPLSISPVPEPASYAMLAAGLLCVTVVARRQPRVKPLLAA